MELGFRIQRPGSRSPDSTIKNFLDSGFHQRRFPDSGVPSTLHEAIYTRNTCRAVNPPRLQILREGMIDDVIMHGTWRHLCKKTRENDVVGIVTFDLIGSLPTNHIIVYITMLYTGVCEETFDINSKIA